MRNSIIYIILPILLSFLNPVSAQNTAAHPALEHLTLDEAINWSLNNNPGLIAQRLKVQQEEQELARIRLNKIPDVFLSGDLRRNLIVPSTPIPATIMNPQADPAEVLYMKFNTGWNSSAGINLSFDIFNPADYRQTMEQKLQRKIRNYDLQISETDIRTEVTKAYAACVISKEQLTSISNDTAYYSESLSEAAILYDQKKISLTDKNSIVIAYNVSKMQYHNAENILNESKANLLYLLGVEATTDNLQTMALSEDIPTLYAKINSEIRQYADVNSATDSVLAGSNLARQSEVIALAQSRIKTSRLKNAPSVTLNGFYGSNYYSNDFNPGKSEFWHGNSYLTVSLKIPVTQAFSISKETNRLKLQEQIERENLRDLQNSKSKEWIEARSRLTISVKEYEMFRQNYELSTENLKARRAELEKAYIQEKDYLKELVNTANAYQSFLKAAYNVFINTIELQRLESE
ncbi:MAG TPA: TolC family protein [Bacteroidales bacterium]|nr:TolC family protein [Bacteroidales bacterium]